MRVAGRVHPAQTGEELVAASRSSAIVLRGDTCFASLSRTRWRRAGKCRESCVAS